jgi:DNA (cytosine-5)-methyltransferase 1
VNCPFCDYVLPRPTVQEKDGSHRLVKGFKTSYKRMSNDSPASTVTTASGHIGSDNTIHPTQNRVLSILECALLQTFPKDFKWGDALKKHGLMHMREMIGEAVPPAFTKQHGEILQGILSLKWLRAPISETDDRCMKAWDKLTEAAEKDDRRNPKSYYEYSKKEILSGKPNEDKSLSNAGQALPK